MKKVGLLLLILVLMMAVLIACTNADSPPTSIAPESELSAEPPSEVSSEEVASEEESPPPESETVSEYDVVSEEVSSVEDYTPMPIVPLTEEMELRIKESFWRQSSPRNFTVDDVNMRYFNTYSNGVALIIPTPGLRPHGGIWEITIGGYPFTISTWPLLFYILETSEFLEIEDAYEAGMLSREEIRDLSWHSTGR